MLTRNIKQFQDVASSNLPKPVSRLDRKQYQKARRLVKRDEDTSTENKCLDAGVQCKLNEICTLDTNCDSNVQKCPSFTCERTLYSFINHMQIITAYKICKYGALAYNNNNDSEIALCGSSSCIGSEYYCVNAYRCGSNVDICCRYDIDIASVDKTTITIPTSRSKSTFYTILLSLSPVITCIMFTCLIMKCVRSAA